MSLLKRGDAVVSPLHLMMDIQHHGKLQLSRWLNGLTFEAGIISAE
jgi:hypothetical protein